jgi:C4-type Zn-finger protein
MIRAIVEGIVQQAVFELEQQLSDPDEGKELKPEFAEQLQQALGERAKFTL